MQLGPECAQPPQAIDGRGRTIANRNAFYASTRWSSGVPLIVFKMGLHGVLDSHTCDCRLTVIVIVCMA